MPRLMKLSVTEIGALERFAQAHGRTWKSVLRDTYWPNARIWKGGVEGDGYILHGLRNQPNWGLAGLAAFKLPKD